MAGSSPDTTSDTRRFEAFARNPALLTAVLDAAGVLLVVLDRGGRVVFFNRACEDTTGFSAAEVLERPIWDVLLVPEEVESVKARFTGLMEGRSPGHNDHFWVTRDGRRRWIRWSNTALTDGDGTVRRVIGAGIDITDQRTAKETLAEVRERTHVILDTTVDGIVVINEQGIMESFNQAAERIFGYRADEVIGHNVKMLMPSPDRDAHDAYIRSYVETGQKRIIGVGREVTGLRRDGSRVALDLAIGEVKLPDKRLSTGILRDIDERKQAEEDARRRAQELAQASRLAAVGQLSSSIAHELNQPLAAIMTFAEACVRLHQSGSADPAVLQRALEQIAEQGERAGAIVRGLRQLVRKGKVNRMPVAVNDMVQDALGIIAHEFRARFIRVSTDFDGGLPAVLANRIQLQQVTLNLVRNAVEALQEVEAPQRRLSILTRRVGDGMGEVAVGDSGRGVSPEQAEKIFDTFYTTKPDGMGMGLAISRGIIQAHGGHLWVEHPPGSTVFRFTLPPHVAEDRPDESDAA